MEKPPHILLVDDDDTADFLHEHLLRQLNVTGQVQVAHAGRAALNLLIRLAPYSPALLLLDVSMPGMDSIEFPEAYLCPAPGPAGSSGYHHTPRPHRYRRFGSHQRGACCRSGQQAPSPG
jgi:hypothetical protein